MICPTLAPGYSILFNSDQALSYISDVAATSDQDHMHELGWLNSFTVLFLWCPVRGNWPIILKFLAACNCLWKLSPLSLRIKVLTWVCKSTLFRTSLTSIYSITYESLLTYRVAVKSKNFRSCPFVLASLWRVANALRTRAIPRRRNGITIFLSWYFSAVKTSASHKFTLRQEDCHRS